MATSGAVLSAFVAGCNSGGSPDEDSVDPEQDGGDGGTGPADFTDVDIALPSSPSVRNEITVTVSATNSGGEAGTFSDTLAVTEGNSSFREDVEITDVGPGETGTAEFSTTFQFADEYVFTLEDADVQQSVEPAPLTRAPGDSLEVSESLRLTFDGVSFEQTVPVRANRFSWYVDTVGNGVFEAPSDKILALFRFTIENTGTDTDRLDFQSLAGPNENVYTSLGPSAIDSVTLEDPFLFDSVDGFGDDTTRFTEVQPSQLHSGWILAQFPRESARDQVALDFQADATETPPEAVFRKRAGDGQFGLPEYRLDDLQIEQIDSAGEYEVSATVTNTGDGPGNFAGVFQWQQPDTEDARWVRDGGAENRAFQARLAPGETQEFSTITEGQFDGTYNYRFAPFAESTEIQFPEG